MAPTFWATIISTISLFITVMVALFFMGVRWAKVGAKVDSIDRRLDQIERLFRLTLRENGRGNRKNYV